MTLPDPPKNKEDVAEEWAEKRDSRVTDQERNKKRSGVISVALIVAAVVAGITWFSSSPETSAPSVSPTPTVSYAPVSDEREQQIADDAFAEFKHTVQHVPAQAGIPHLSLYSQIVLSQTGCTVRFALQPGDVIDKQKFAQYTKDIEDQGGHWHYGIVHIDGQPGIAEARVDCP